MYFVKPPTPTNSSTLCDILTHARLNTQLPFPESVLFMHCSWQTWRFCAHGQTILEMKGRLRDRGLYRTRNPIPESVCSTREPLRRIKTTITSNIHQRTTLNLCTMFYDAIKIDGLIWESVLSRPLYYYLVSHTRCQIWRQSGSDWPQMDQIRNFLDHISEHFDIWIENVSDSCYLGPIWPTFRTNLTSV